MESSVFDLLDDIDGRARASITDRYDYRQADRRPPDAVNTQFYLHPQSYREGTPHYESCDERISAHEAGLVEELPFDAFDQELLRQPYDDRRRQAEEGRARLTLGPTNTIYANTQSSQYEAPSLGTAMEEQHERAPRRDLSQFMYNASQGVQSSSSPRGLPSSPAFKASQRRNGSGSNHVSTQRYHRQEREPIRTQAAAASDFQPSYYSADPPPVALSHAPQLVQGIELVSTRQLPDRFRSVFKWPVFNAVQSKCFDTVYKTKDNFVLSSPTGSGKTAILELAICRVIIGCASEQYKIVYQAPTKSLCSERQRDWQAKFGPLDLQCAELTGDTDQAQMRNVQNASIIVTTPEKWDSMTRKWKDHEKLMQLVKLFLIDEVHILKEDRGATLEAVVSRMKSVGSDVRFIALSATVPNSDDIATWLGKDPMNQHVPAPREKFGEDFRPVKLQKHVVGYTGNVNDFAFDKMLDTRLPDVIAKYSHRKPIMVFCCTRASTVNTAKLLANLWATKGPKDRFWEGPRRPITVADNDLRNTVTSAVAFHHAGIEQGDRQAVESGFLNGNINVICCTSTLAVGVNLPCHFVIIKNTVTYVGSSCKEYSDLEVMQMLGRAGRPQFDDSAVAVIMTRKEKIAHYEKMVSGQEILESCLHLNLIDHLNAEIGLGTITDVHTARRWLMGTFLYVRMKRNPNHYKLAGDTGGKNLEERLEHICSTDISLLKEQNLVSGDPRLKPTEFGDAMARYYLQFETMKIFLGLPRKAKLSEILSALAQAAEFKEVRFRSGEKSVYKELNRSPSIKFPIPVDLALPAHKVSLVIQSVLGGVELPVNDNTAKYKPQYNTDVAIVFQHVHRLIRCIIDCQLYLEDSIASRNALALARSLGARVWDDSPLQLKQIEQIGIVAVRKLVNAGIKTIEELENTEPHRVETILSKHPPFGMKLLDRLRAFPKLRVSMRMVGRAVVRAGEGVKVNIRAEIGFMNDKPPLIYQRKVVYVCLLADTSDGHKIHFCRISAKKLSNDQEVLFSATLTNPSQSISCYVMCDEIAGTLRQATLKPDIPPSMFPAARVQNAASQVTNSLNDLHKPGMNTSKRRSESSNSAQEAHRAASDGFGDDFGDEDIDDSDFMRIAGGGDLDFRHIDSYGDETASLTRKNTVVNRKRKDSVREAVPNDDGDSEPRQLDNGKWACNHRCKDKNACKHLCCREGLDKPPKPTKKTTTTADHGNTPQTSNKQQKKQPAASQRPQSKLKLTSTKNGNLSYWRSPSKVPHLDLSTQDASDDYAKHAPRDYKKLHSLHTSVQRGTPPVAMSLSRKKSANTHTAESDSNLSFLPSIQQEGRTLTDYGDDSIEELPPSFDPAGDEVEMTVSQLQEPDYPEPMDDFNQVVYDDDEEMLEAAMVGLADSQNIQATQVEAIPSSTDKQPSDETDYNQRFALPLPSTPDNKQNGKKSLPASISETSLQPSLAPSKAEKSLFVSLDASSPRITETVAKPESTGFKRAGALAEDPRPSTPPAKRQKVDKELADERATQPDASVEGVAVPPGYEDVDPELLRMFGDCVEFV